MLGYYYFTSFTESTVNSNSSYSGSFNNNIAALMSRSNSSIVRTAYVLTLNTTDARTVNSQNLLEKIGFRVELIRAIPHPNKPHSNKLSMTYIIELIQNGTDNYAYIFENDISIHEPIDISEIVQYEAISEMFFYLGVCYKKPKKIFNWSKFKYEKQKYHKFVDTNYTINNHKVKQIVGTVACLHAIAMSKLGAKKILEFSVPHKRSNMDVIIGVSTLTYPANVVRYDLKSYHVGHRGILYQDRRKFKTTIWD